MEEQQRALLCLHLTPGLGRTALFKIHHYFADFSAALQAPPRQLREAGLSQRLIDNIQPADSPPIRAVRRQLETLQVRLLSYWDAAYPSLLREIHDPPALLYLRGKLPDKDCFAVVGSRRATAAGLQLTWEISSTLAKHNICIVSGLARGVDSSAHQGALDGGGSTIAVLGCGIDRIYPP